MRRLAARRVTVLAGVLLALVGVLAGCSCESGNSQLSKQQQKAVTQRAQAFSRAEAAWPVPKTNNFPLRETLVTMTERDDLLNHPWYVYILGMNGNVIGYYVSKTDPVNACDFLSSTENVGTYGDNAGVAVTTAPSLDGIYYGGAGSSAGCDAWVFLDESTNALVKIRGLPFYVADQPLNLDAQPIKVSK